MPKDVKKIKTLNIIFNIIVFFLIPATIFLGIHFFGGRKYYLISLLIIGYTMLPFFLGLERKKENSRQIVLLSVLCSLAVVSRAAFYMLPQVKPMAAIVIITAVVFGKQSGFLVGSISAFVSNFFFGQGPWTPWQMVAFGLLGYFAGLTFSKVSKNKISICLYGFFATLIIYGGIVNLGTALTFTNEPNFGQLLTTYTIALPMDLIHALSTSVFLFIISKPMIEKLDRIKIKYGLNF